MTTIGPTGRAAVQAFFQYQLDDDDLELRTPSSEVRVGVALVTGLLGYGAVGFIIGFGTHAPLAGFALALTAGLAVCISVQRVRIVRDLEERCVAKAANHKEFRRLTYATRSFQADQVARALCRVVGRTHIDRRRLARFDTRHLLEQERALFDEGKLERKIGDLIDKSMRTLSLGDAFSPEITAVSRRVRGPADEPGQLYFNPIRLVALLVTESELVCCLVQVDTMGANRHEEIRRISLANIVDLRFEDTHEHVAASPESLDSLAEQLGYSKREIVEQLGAPDQRGALAEARVTSRLTLTSSDGATLTLPIRRDVQLVGSSGGFSPDDDLSVDELEIDHMVHTLHRLLRSQGSSALTSAQRVRAVK
jgi:hypothetical protein